MSGMRPKACHPGQGSEKNFCFLSAAKSQWSAWSPWSACSHTCSGIKKRIRMCNSPTPSQGGLPCAGLKEEIALCNKRCPGTASTLDPVACHQNICCFHQWQVRPRERLFAKAVSKALSFHPVLFSPLLTAVSFGLPPSHRDTSSLHSDAQNRVHFPTCQICLHIKTSFVKYSGGDLYSHSCHGCLYLNCCSVSSPDLVYKLLGFFSEQDSCGFFFKYLYIVK